MGRNILPYAVTRDAVTGANSRATQSALLALGSIVYKNYEGAYTEPLVLAVGSIEPYCIEAVRVINRRNQPPQDAGGACNFEFQPKNGGAYIYSVPGLTSDPESRFRIHFRITFVKV